MGPLRQLKSCLRDSVAFPDWRNVGGYPIDLGAFVKNLGTEEYYTGGTSVYPTLGTAAQTFGDPRQWGLSLTYRFRAMADR